MSDALASATNDAVPNATAPAPEAAAPHGRHRGHSAADDTPEADPHGRHRLAAGQD